MLGRGDDSAAKVAAERKRYEDEVARLRHELNVAMSTPLLGRGAGSQYLSRNALSAKQLEKAISRGHGVEASLQGARLLPGKRNKKRKRDKGAGSADRDSAATGQVAGRRQQKRRRAQRQ